MGCPSELVTRSLRQPVAGKPVGRASVQAMSARTIVIEWLRHSAIGFALVVGAALLSGFLHGAVTPEFRGAYAVLFALCMMPFLFFARSRGALSFKSREIVAFLVFALLIGLVPRTFLGGHLSLVVTVLLFVGLMWLIRRFIPVRDRDD